MRKFALLLLPALFLLGGCLSPEQQLVGKYKGKIDMGGPLKATPMGAMASGYASMLEPQLDLKPDKTFSLNLSMAPVNGTWRLDHDQLILTPKSVMGMSANEVKDRAAKEIEHSKRDMPFQMPNLASMMEMKAVVDHKEQKITLDPGNGTMLAGFGKIVFTKV